MSTEHEPAQEITSESIKPQIRRFNDRVDINDDGHVRVDLAQADEHRTPEEIDELITGLKWAADQGTFKQAVAYDKGDIIYVDDRKHLVESRSASRYGEYGAASVRYATDWLNMPKGELALPTVIWHREITRGERLTDAERAAFVAANDDDDD